MNPTDVDVIAVITMTWKYYQIWYSRMYNEDNELQVNQQLPTVE